MDRIDIYIHVPRPAPEEVMHTTETTAKAGNDTVRKTISRCREIQKQRCLKRNSDLNTVEIKKYCRLDAHSQSLLKKVMTKLSISARGYHRILRIARTIADLEGHQDIQYSDLSEAIGYRRVHRRVPQNSISG